MKLQAHKVLAVSDKKPEELTDKEIFKGFEDIFVRIQETFPKYHLLLDKYASTNDFFAPLKNKQTYDSTNRFNDTPQIADGYEGDSYASNYTKNHSTTENENDGNSMMSRIMEGLESDKIRFIQKAENPEIEEYGAFANLQPDEEGWFQAGDNVVVCGIASEYCVLETLKNIIRLRDAIGFNVSVFMDGCGCFESQQPLLDFMNEHSVPEYK